MPRTLAKDHSAHARLDHRRRALGAAIAASAAATALGVVAVPAASATVKATGSTIVTPHPTVTQIGSTVPANGDVNPYGIVPVTHSTGRLVAGDTLISNFNDKANVQGTGSTVVEVSPGGSLTVFAALAHLPSGLSCPGGVGLTTAVALLPNNDVVVGSFPDDRSASATPGSLPTVNPAGCLIVLNSSGKAIASWTGPLIDGPWDMTAVPTSTGADLFVADDLSNPVSSTNPSASPTRGQGDIVRLGIAIGAGKPHVTSETVIGRRFAWRASSVAFVQGPTGVALSGGTLYVAETLRNEIVAIPNASTRSTPVVARQHVITKRGSLRGPLGLTTAPNGDLIAANGNNGRVVEITEAGVQAASATLVANGAGDLFGLAVAPDHGSLLFVNDGTNALDQATFHH